jgi:hypothetical protein
LSRGWATRLQEIVFADYDPEWPRLFGRAEEQIPTQDDG